MVDGIPLSRPKNHINRDFSDGGICFRLYFLSPDSTERNIPFEHAVMMAELIKHFRPKLVEMHNYSCKFIMKKKYN